MRQLSILCTVWAVLILTVTPTPAAQLTVIGFNVESGGADPHAIGHQLASIQACDIWGFSEVLDESWAAELQEGTRAGKDVNFQRILGTSGRDDRLLIIYNSDRLEALRHFEIDAVNVGGHVRAPLVAEFALKASGLRFLFMVNHLYRTNEQRRHEQAGLLNAWAAAQSLPVIAVGDYNFDWKVAGGIRDHDSGFDLLTHNDVFSWIPPRRLLPTKCGTPAVLDFTFVAGPARAWPATAQILFAEGSYCADDSTTSDHRPVRTTFTLPDEGVETSPARPAHPPTMEMLLRRIERIERAIGLPPLR